MAGAADALQEARDRARRADLADEIDVADVDAEFERGGGDQRLQLAALEPLLGVEPLLLGEAAVMRRHLLLAEPLGELARRPLGQPARVDEDQRRAVRLDQLGQAVVDLSQTSPDITASSGEVGNFEREIARATVAGVDDRAADRSLAPAAPTRNRATSSIGFCVADRPMRSRRRRTAQRAARATAPDARRACSARPRGSRRR